MSGDMHSNKDSLPVYMDTREAFDISSLEGVDMYFDFSIYKKKLAEKSKLFREIFCEPPDYYSKEKLKKLAEKSQVLRKEMFSGPSPDHIDLGTFSTEALSIFCGFVNSTSKYRVPLPAPCNYDLILELLRLAYKYSITELSEELEDAMLKVDLKDSDVFELARAINVNCGGNSRLLSYSASRILDRLVEYVYRNEVDLLDVWAEYGNTDLQTLYFLNAQMNGFRKANSRKRGSKRCRNCGLKPCLIGSKVMNLRPHIKVSKKILVHHRITAVSLNTPDDDNDESPTLSQEITVGDQTVYYDKLEESCEPVADSHITYDCCEFKDVEKSDSNCSSDGYVDSDDDSYEPTKEEWDQSIRDHLDIERHYARQEVESSSLKDDEVCKIRLRLSQTLLALKSPMFLREKQVKKYNEQTSWSILNDCSIEAFAVLSSYVESRKKYQIIPAAACRGKLFSELYLLAFRFEMDELVELLDKWFDEYNLQGEDVFEFISTLPKMRERQLEAISTKITEKCVKYIHYKQIDLLKLYKTFGESDGDALSFLKRELEKFRGKSVEPVCVNCRAKPCLDGENVKDVWPDMRVSEYEYFYHTIEKVSVDHKDFKTQKPEELTIRGCKYYYKLSEVPYRRIPVKKPYLYCRKRNKSALIYRCKVSDKEICDYE